MAPKGFCPFSLFLFVSSAVASVRYLQQQRSKTKGDDEEPFRVVFVLGGPGAGKGTQCQLLSTNLGWCHLSAGDLLRAERTKANSKLADIINSNINAGKIVPSDITVRLLQNAMYEHRTQTGQTKFLIDGFPRSEGNVSSWNIIFNNNNNMEEKENNAIVANIECVLFFECPEEVLISRLLERSKTSGRVDDSSIDIIRQRFATYHEESMPIINMYEKHGIVRKIIADRTIEQVYMEVESILKE
jgi:UMP-CMP kinase